MELGVTAHGVCVLRGIPTKTIGGVAPGAILLVLAVDRVGGIGEMPRSKTDLENTGARVSFLIKRFMGAAGFGATAHEWLT